jgi:undecaprenyl-diphosphatase
MDSAPGTATMSKSQPMPEDRRAEPRASSEPVRHALFTFFRMIAKNVSGFYAAVGTLLLVALGLIALCAIFFVTLANVVMKGGTQKVDDAILLWLNDQASPALTGIALDFTALGSGLIVWLVILVASVFLWNSRHRWSVALLWVSILGAGLINATLKTLFDRPRPQLFPWRVPYAGLSSFPSGHSMTAMVCYATLAYLMARLAPTRFLSRFTIAGAAVLVLLIGVSRMYLGVHYPTDVLAGFTMGLAWAAFCAIAMEALRYFRRREPAIAAQERDLDATATGGPTQVPPAPAKAG